MKHKFFAFVLFFIFCVSAPFALSGCKQNKNTIKINEVTHSVFYAPLYLAEALGYFSDEDINIELTNGGGADATMAAILSGGADIGFCGPEAAIYVLNGNTTNSPKVFGQLTKRDGSFLVGRSFEQNFSWESLSGKEILAGRKGGVPAQTFEYILKSENISATLNYGVAFNMMTSAFESGVADYCTMFEPTASEYQAAGKGYILASVGEKSGEIPYTCFIAKESYIQKNRQKLEGFLRAVTRAIKYVFETDSEEIAKKLSSYFDGTSEESLKTSVESYKKIDAWVENMAMKESAFDNLQNIIELSGELEKRVAFSDLVLNDMAQAAYEKVYGNA